MATYSSILAWEIPWREEPGGRLSMASQRYSPWIKICDIRFKLLNLWKEFASLHPEWSYAYRSVQTQYSKHAVSTHTLSIVLNAGVQIWKDTALGKHLEAHNLAASSAKLFRFETEFVSVLLINTERKFEKNQDNSGNNIPALPSK